MSKTYMIKWLDGSKETISGSSLHEAWNKNGYTGKDVSNVKDWGEVKAVPATLVDNSKIKS